MQIIDPLTFLGWDKLVLQHPNSTFFHSSAWARVLHDSYGYEPLYFAVLDDGLLSACLPVMEINSLITGRRGVSLPFTDYCEPLALAPELMEEVFVRAIDYGRSRGWKSLEIRGGGSFFDDKPSSSAYLAHTVELANGCDQSSIGPCDQKTDGLDSIFSRFRESTRRNIRKSLERGVTPEMSTDQNAVKQFYRLNQRTRRAHGIPPQPYCFLQEIYDHVISKGQGFVALAWHDGAAIAASVFFCFGESAVYKFGASDARWHHLRPNNLVMWEAIRTCHDRGCTQLSLGRTDLEHEGLRQYKTGWGVLERRVDYHRFNLTSAAFERGCSPLGSTKSAVFKRMPMPVLSAIGSLSYRHIG
jgi:lipid II:glycine glycyltransferase (peptidoglycan interpeptide bridge formation enzyme)